jgi:hypothetical protein
MTSGAASEKKFWRHSEPDFTPLPSKAKGIVRELVALRRSVAVGRRRTGDGKVTGHLVTCGSAKYLLSTTAPTALDWWRRRPCTSSRLELAQRQPHAFESSDIRDFLSSKGS